jgi:hypothetical protein
MAQCLGAGLQAELFLSQVYERASAERLDYAYFVDAAAGEVDAAVGCGGHVAHGAAS